MKPTRISLIIATLGGGGAERTALGLANRWSASGAHVTITTLAQSDSDAYELPSGVERRSLGGLTVSGNAIAAVRDNVDRVRALRRALRDDDPDVVVSFLDTTNVRTVLAARGLDAPVVLCESSDPRHFPLPRPWRVLRRLTYQRAAALVIHAEQIRPWAERLMRRADRVHVIPNAVWIDPPPGTRGQDRERRTIVGMGRLVTLKGFDLLIQAFAAVADRNPAWDLTIHGEGPERTNLEALAQRLGIGHRVLLPGYTKNPAAVLADADLFVLSSRTESAPLVLVEAMACGAPVVSFDCPSGPSEVIDDGIDGVLVPTEDAPALATALDDLMSDPERRAELSAAAGGILDRFGPEPVMAGWNSVITAVHRALAAADPAEPGSK